MVTLTRIYYYFSKGQSRDLAEVIHRLFTSHNTTKLFPNFLDIQNK